MPSFPPSGGGSISPAGLPDYSVYADASGSDSASGSVGAPKKTLYAATLAAINAGGGTVNFNDSTPIGGTVANQGLWLRNDGIQVDGFLNLNNTKLRFIGNGNQSGSFIFERPGAARFFGVGTASADFYKPGLWIVGSESPLDFNFGKNFAPPFSGLAAPCRLGWDYIRDNNGDIDLISVSSAHRSSGITELTLDLSTAATYEVIKAQRTSNVTTLTIQLGDNQNCTPWVTGAVIRVVLNDVNFADGDYQVTNQSDSFAQQLLGQQVTVSYTETAANHGLTTVAGTAVSSGCAINDRIALESVNVEFPNCCMMRVTFVDPTDASRINVRDPYGYGARSATTTQSDIGTIVKQSRGRSAVSAVSMYRSSFYGNGSVNDFPSFGPTVDIGCVSANPIRFRECYMGGNLIWHWTGVSEDNVDFDRTCVALFCDPGAGGAGATSFEAVECQSQDGQVRIYGGSSGGNQGYINYWLQDSSGSDSVPTVEVVEGGTFDSYFFDRIAMADGTVPAVKVCAGLDPLRVTIGEIYSSHNPPVENLSYILGPRNMRAASWNASSPPNESPWQLGWNQSAWTGGLTGRHVNVNRAMSTVAARFANQFPPYANWEDHSSFPAGVTVTNNSPAPDGSNTAFKFVSDGQYTVELGDVPLGSITAGDRVVFGCWVNFDQPSELQLAGSGGATFDNLGVIRVGRNIIYDNAWQWVVSPSTVTHSGTYNIQLFISAAGDSYIWAPTALIIPASVPDSDAWELMQNLKHQPIYLPAGMSGTMENTKLIAHGGLGVSDTLAKTVGAGSGELTLTGTGTTYIPVYAADGVTIQGWIAQLQATVNP